MEGDLQARQGSVRTPYYLIDEAALERNLKVLASVRKRAGVKILLAQKAFSAFDTYPLIAKYLDGTTASGIYEARLAHEEMPTRENHVFNPAFTDEEFSEVAKWCDHIVLISVSQNRRFTRLLNRLTAQSLNRPSLGLRVNKKPVQSSTRKYEICFAPALAANNI